MDNLALLFKAAWQVLLVGLLLGAGLPALFATGVKFLAYGAGGDAETDVTTAPHPVGRVLGIACFVVVAVAVLFGVTVIVASGFGKAVSFESIFPVIIDKGH